MYKQPKVYSSYARNDLGETLYSLVKKYKPKKIIDFGVLHGYSTIAMGQAIKDLGTGKIYAYDLFEKYPYRYARMVETKDNIKKYGLDKIVTLRRKNFYDWLKKPEKFNLMHLDISNNGKILELVYKKLKKYIESGSVLVFEGGTKERDKVEWMIKYKFPPIYPLKKKLGYQIVDKRFPGLSLFSKK